MDAAAERAGRGTFSSIVRKSAHYFGRTILQNLAQDNGVLKVAYVIKVRQFCETQELPNFFYAFIVLIANYFVLERAIL